MTEVRFYHMQTKQLEQALPEVLEKAVGGNRRVVVKAANQNQVEQINNLLWTYRENSFLPHGSEKDGHSDDQPIWITSEDENPNGADVLVLINGAISERICDFSLCCEFLDGRDEEAVTSARERWKQYKEDGFDLTYWQQSSTGAWEQK
jgi:DNA polymerase-3 subunit chi